MLSEYICLKKFAIAASVRTAWRASVLQYMYQVNRALRVGVKVRYF